MNQTSHTHNPTPVWEDLYFFKAHAGGGGRQDQQKVFNCMEGT